MITSPRESACPVPPGPSWLLASALFVYFSRDSRAVSASDNVRRIPTIVKPMKDLDVG